MKVLRANNPKLGTKPIVVSLTDLSNLKLRDYYDPETMNGRTKRYINMKKTKKKTHKMPSGKTMSGKNHKEYLKDKKKRKY